MKKILDKNELCSVCGRYDNRGISVDIIIFDKIKQKILLGKRGREPFKDYWGTFGGFIEWNESPEEAVKREAKEESNLDVISMKLLGVYGNPKRHPRQVITIAYVVEVSGQSKPGDDIDEIKWFNLNSMPEVLAFDHRKVIEDAILTLK